jgi:hypothetical protein
MDISGQPSRQDLISLEGDAAWYLRNGPDQLVQPTPDAGRPRHDRSWWRR